MTRTNLFKAFKITLAAVQAIWFAGCLQLNYAVTAGILELKA